MLVALLTGALLAGCDGGSGSGAEAPEALPAAAPVPPPAALTAEESRGRQVFRAYCISCHSVDGRGLAPLGVDLTTSRFVGERSDRDLAGFLLRGRSPEAPESRTGRQMPGLAGLPEVGAPEVEALVAHLRRINRSS